MMKGEIQGVQLDAEQVEELFGSVQVLRNSRRFFPQLFFFWCKIR